MVKDFFTSKVPSNVCEDSQHLGVSDILIHVSVVDQEITEHGIKEGNIFPLTITTIGTDVTSNSIVK